MDIYGLLGAKLAHSLSPDFFNEKFKKLGINAEYRLFELDNIDDFPDLISSNPNLVGLNVTIPYKRSMARFIDKLDSIVHITGSLNTIKISKTKKGSIITAYNTDVIGFEKTLSPYLKKKDFNNALILGSGGSSKSVAYVLRKHGILFKYVSRKGKELHQSGYDCVSKNEILKNKLIINTTPVGMFPDVDDCPKIPYEFITNEHLLYDLVYNPKETVFLKKGKEQGATCVNGYKMLRAQAEASFKIWQKR